VKNIIDYRCDRPELRALELRRRPDYNISKGREFAPGRVSAPILICLNDILAGKHRQKCPRDICPGVLPFAGLPTQRRGDFFHGSADIGL
jgi:hypothetical protein